MVTSHSVPITGLTTNTLYHYRVKSKDAASNLATSTDNTFTTATAADLLTGLIAMWKLDEPNPTDTRVVSAGPTSNNFLPRAPGIASGAGPVGSGTGQIGLAAHFLGDNNHLECLNNSDVQSGNIDFTWSLWVKIDSLAADADFISKSSANVLGSDEYLIGYVPGATPATTGKFRFTVYGGSTYSSVYSTSSAPPVVGQWYLIVAWHTSGTTYIQINNGPIDSAPIAEPIFASASMLNVGSYGAGQANSLHGFVDELAYWKALLTVSSRSALWGGGAGLPFSSWT